MSQDIVINGAVLSYPHLFKAVVAKAGGDPRFGASLILPENFDWTGVQQAIQEAIAAKWPTGAPANLPMPFNQVTEGPYAGRYQLKAYAKADSPPQVVMQDPSIKAGPHQAQEFFAGAMVNAYVRAYGYTQGGVSLHLNAVQLVSNDPSLPRLDSLKAATEVFQTIAGAPAATATVPGGEWPAGFPAGAGQQPGAQMGAAPAQPAYAAPTGAPLGAPTGSGVPVGTPAGQPLGQPDPGPQTAPAQPQDVPAGNPPGMPWNS